ncbi:hypothetical protein ACJMK2_020873 [Sinanodonta woodiana]|uniref:DDE-1 domain-containing protein n=1 Tax=Sinanodonta woodiana TaxID=1069815 RepID=A0ABD3U3W4_SINWO
MVYLCKRPSNCTTEKVEKAITSLLETWQNSFYIGVGRSKQHIVNLVSDIVITGNWYGFIIKRCPYVRLCNPKSLLRAARRNEQKHNFFSLLSHVLTKYALLHYPEQYVNADKTGMPLDHKPPIIVKLMPLCTSLCININGWTDSELFKTCITEHFVRHIPPARVALMLIYGHSTHAKLNVVRKYKALGIIIFALHPHTTHINYKSKCSILLEENRGRVVSRFIFGKLFVKVCAKSLISSTIINLFAKCGIHLFQPKLTLQNSSTSAVHDILNKSIYNMFDKSGFSVTNAKKRKPNVHSRALSKDGKQNEKKRKRIMHKKKEMRTI